MTAATGKIRRIEAAQIKVELQQETDGLMENPSKMDELG